MPRERQVSGDSSCKSPDIDSGLIGKKFEVCLHSILTLGSILQFTGIIAAFFQLGFKSRLIFRGHIPINGVGFAVFALLPFGKCSGSTHKGKDKQRKHNESDGTHFDLLSREVYARELSADHYKVLYYLVKMRDVSAIPAIFGPLLRTLRVEAGLSQEQLAAQCGMDRSAISLLERQKNQPSLASLVLISEALGMTAAELIGRVEADIPQLPEGSE
uniref:Transcriptional regulator, XRE family n=2 Tax=Desulfovibrio TaxID=872 RepID=B8J3W0_DESDA